MLENLNPEQRLATETTEGAVLVLSGAGTGKTRVLTMRVVYILSNGLAMPWQIMALTFTNKTANEMKARVAQMLPSQSDGVWMGTFHSIALRILRFNAERAGLRKDFLIFGEDDQKSVLKTVLTGMGLDPKEYNPGDWVEKISAVKDKGYPAKPRPGIQKIYDAYNAELTRMNGVDFGDIILKVLELFETAPDILEKYQKQFKYILVDEFQDTNDAQHQFLKALASGFGNICCVGDDDQSIYSWRGAEIKHILNFNKVYPNAKIIRLETNYRSTGNILGAANSLIRQNSDRLGKDLHPAPGMESGEKVYVMTLPTDRTEARMISEGIIRDVKDKDYSNFAVLIRTGSLSRILEEEFAERAIPYRLVGTTKFYDRMEIRDVVAYVRLLVHPFDDLSFLRIIGKPRRGFGGSAITKLRDFGNNLMAALRASPLSGRQRISADEFLRAFDFEWDLMKPCDAVEQLLESAGYLKMWRESKDVDAEERISNIKELLSNVISKYDNLSEFLEHAALMMTDDNDAEDKDIKNAVSIMTIHAAKGLEFNTVFLPAWEEGIFPNERAIGEGGLEEERRLAYVAITRARRRAVISNSLSRMVFGKMQNNSPSRFIAEIDSNFLHVTGGMSSYRPVNQIPTSYSRPAARPVVQSTSLVGKLAFHAEMGQGVIIEENDDILTVAFRNHGIKKVARDFIKAG